MLETLTKELEQRRNLSADAVRGAVSELVAENIRPETKAEFLAALAAKGETVDEIAACQ